MTAVVVDLAAYRDGLAAQDVSRVGDLPAVKQAPRETNADMSCLLKRSEPRGTDTRGDLRHEILGSLQLSLSLSGRPALLRNVSPNGFMAETDFDHAIGDDVLVCFIGCNDMRGRVVWRVGKRLGIELPLGAMQLRGP